MFSRGRMWCGGVTRLRHTLRGLDFGSVAGETCPQVSQVVLRLDDGRAENRRGIGLEVRGVRKGKHYPSEAINQVDSPSQCNVSRLLSCAVDRAIALVGDRT